MISIDKVYALDRIGNDSVLPVLPQTGLFGLDHCSGTKFIYFSMLLREQNLVCLMITPIQYTCEAECDDKADLDREGVFTILMVVPTPFERHHQWDKIDCPKWKAPVSI